MKKTIMEDQVKAILDAFYQANAGVQVCANLKKMLDELPEAPKEETKKK